MRHTRTGRLRDAMIGVDFRTTTSAGEPNDREAISSPAPPEPIAGDGVLIWAAAVLAEMAGEAADVTAGEGGAACAVVAGEAGTA